MSLDMEIIKSLKPTDVIGVNTLEGELSSQYEGILVNSTFLNLKSVEGMYKSILDLGKKYDKNEEAEDTKEQFVNVNTEVLSELQPDIILRTAHAMPEKVMEMFSEEFETNDIWKHFEAVNNGKVYDLDSKLFGMSANFNYQSALENLQSILYGEEN